MSTLVAGGDTAGRWALLQRQGRQMGSPHLARSLITPPKEHAKGVEAATDGSPLPPHPRSAISRPDPSEAAPHPRQMTPNQTPLWPKTSLSMLSVLLLNERPLKWLKLWLSPLFPPSLTPGIIIQLTELGLPGTYSLICSSF